MSPYDIFLAYISWGESGKYRPILVYSLENSTAKAYQITTKFADKSKSIQSQYFEIKDWQQAGLQKPCYVNTIDKFTFPVAFVEQMLVVGKLTQNDKARFIRFLRNK
jgi:hypothetical protein